MAHGPVIRFPYPCRWASADSTRQTVDATDNTRPLPLNAQPSTALNENLRRNILSFNKQEWVMIAESLQHNKCRSLPHRKNVSMSVSVQYLTTRYLRLITCSIASTGYAISPEKTVRREDGVCEYKPGNNAKAAPSSSPRMSLKKSAFWVSLAVRIDSLAVMI